MLLQILKTTTQKYLSRRGESEIGLLMLSKKGAYKTLHIQPPRIVNCVHLEQICDIWLFFLYF